LVCWPCFVFGAQRICELLPNGDFEAGHEPWTWDGFVELGTEFFDCAREPACAQFYNFHLGGYFGVISQNVSIPSGAPSIRFHLETVASSVPCENNHFFVVFVGITEIFREEVCNETAHWREEYEIDVSEWAGKLDQISFFGEWRENASGQGSEMFLDNISLCFDEPTPLIFEDSFENASQ